MRRPGGDIEDAAAVADTAAVGATAVVAAAPLHSRSPRSPHGLPHAESGRRRRRGAAAVRRETKRWGREA